MSGIYVHIPFCENKCRYCNFYSITNRTYMADYVSAVEKEIILRRYYLPYNKIDSLYFGGGTPSLLPITLVERLINIIAKYFDISTAEITFEANPNSLTKEYLQALHSIGINRISIGVQSFNNRHLHLLGRIHTAQQAEESIEQTIKAGFDNFSVDLIYAIPTMTINEWKENLKKVIDCPHISCYALTVEEGTSLMKIMKNNPSKYINEDDILEQIELLNAFAKRFRFRHYEISNFCKQKKYSKHNWGYWMRQPYLGLGAAAHSFNRYSRQWNCSNVSDYVKYINVIYEKKMKNALLDCSTEYKQLVTKEILSQKDQINEYIMTAIRTDVGVSIHSLGIDFSQQIKNEFIAKLRTINHDYYIWFGGHVRLTDSGRLLADRITANLFF